MIRQSLPVTDDHHDRSSPLQMPFETTKRHAHLISHSEGGKKIDETDETEELAPVPSSKRQVPSHPSPVEKEEDQEKKKDEEISNTTNTADRQVPSDPSPAEKEKEEDQDQEVSNTVNTSNTFPRIMQNFQRRFFKGMLWNANVYSPSSAGASVRFYPHHPKYLSDVSHLFTVDDVSNLTEVSDLNQGVFSDFAFRATFVLPKLNNRGDVQMVLNMAHAAVKTTIPPSHLIDLEYLDLPPPLPIAPDSSVLLIQVVNEKDFVEKDHAESSFQTKIKSLLNIGFRIVGKINSQPSSSSLGDLTADLLLLRSESAIIFEAKLRTLLATPAPAERQDQDHHSPTGPAFAFKFE